MRESMAIRPLAQSVAVLDLVQGGNTEPRLKGKLETVNECLRIGSRLRYRWSHAAIARKRNFNSRSDNKAFFPRRQAVVQQTKRFDPISS